MERYSIHRVDRTQIYKVQRDILSLSQGTLSVTAYFTKCKKLWDEYLLMVEAKVCGCGSNAVARDILQDQQVVQFLMGLNDAYSLTRGNILMITPSPSIDAVYHMVLQEESQRDLQASHPPVDVESSALAAQRRGSSGYNPRNDEMTSIGAERLRLEDCDHSSDDLPEAENKRPSSAAESPSSLYGVDKSVHVVLKPIEHELMKDKHSFDGLVDLSKILDSTDMSGELLPRYCHSSEISGALKNDDKKISAQEEKMVAGGNLPPLHLVPSTDVWRERNYPPRGRASAIRDFPPGCGTNIPASKNRLQVQPPNSSEGQYRMTELQSNMCVQREKLELAHDRKMEKGASEARDRKEAVAYRKDKEDNKRKNMYPGNDAVLQAGIKQGPMGAVNCPRQQGIATSSRMGADRNQVRETLRLFQAITRKLLQGEATNPQEQIHIRRRVDLKASKFLKENGKCNNEGKAIIGDVPGVEVGDEFHYRAELMIIGLHRLPQAGIDYVKEGGRTLALSVVDSGGYDNKVDDYDVWTYTGQGGNKVPEDQKLERGNLALKNSMQAKEVVRVIRGVRDTKPSEGRPKVSTTYTYYGLYTVNRYWQETVQHGKKEFKFQLKRVSGQRELPWKEVKRSKKLKLREGLCVEDISKGKEPFPICVVNTIDAEKPPPFEYISRMVYTACNPLGPRGCDCIKGCLNSTKCSCAVKNRGGIPYNSNGAIVEAKPLVYECGPSCKCPPSCYNRVSQHGIKFELEIFKTDSRGWGVRSLSSIPSGSFICEYTGELLGDKEAEKRTDNDEYLFDIGPNCNDHSIWEGLSGLNPDAASSSQEVVADSNFTIDAAKYGNVGRFVNHSCSPNLYAQNVLYDHGDTRMPHIMLFAVENIPPLQELTFHYNYKLDQVYDKNGNVKVKYCYCGSPNCTGRMY